MKSAHTTPTRWMRYLISELIRLFCVPALTRKKNEIRIRFGSDSGMIVLIKPTPHATYGNLIDALDEMQTCAVKTYALMDPDKTELEKSMSGSFVLLVYKLSRLHAIFNSSKIFCHL
jgi:hypothetical protein